MPGVVGETEVTARHLSALEVVVTRSDEVVVVAVRPMLFPCPA